MATPNRKIVVEFLGKDSTSKTAQQVEQRFGKMGGKLDKVGQQAGKVLAVGFAAAGVAAVKMAKAAGEDEAAQSKLAQTLKTATGASQATVTQTEAWISAQGKALGVTDDELRPAIGRLAVATKDAAKAQKLAALALDISAGSGKSLEAVTTALAKAQNGSLGGLAKLGIATKDASGKALTLDQVQKNLAKTYSGAAAKGAETSAGKAKIMTTQMGELQEQIGAGLLPVMQKLTEIGLGVTNWISKNSTTTGILVGVLATFTAGLYAVSLGMRAYNTVTAFQELMAKRAAAGQWALNASLLANPVFLVVAGVAALGAALVIAYKKSETFRAIVDGAFRAVKTAASFAFNWVKNNWPLLLGIITGPIGLAVLAVAKNWDKIKSGASNAVGFIKEKFNGVVSFFKGIPGKMANAFDGMFDGIKAAFKSSINFVIDGWNSLKFGIPGFDPPGPGPKFPGVKIGTPHINRLATGAVVKARPGGILANIGEGKYDEGVFPLDSNGMPRGMAGAMGGVTYNFNVSGAMDPAAVATQIQQMLLKLKRTNGRELGIA